MDPQAPNWGPFRKRLRDPKIVQESLSYPASPTAQCTRVSPSLRRRRPKTVRHVAAAAALDSRLGFPCSLKRGGYLSARNSEVKIIELSQRGAPGRRAPVGAVSLSNTSWRDSRRVIEGAARSLEHCRCEDVLG